MTITTTTAIRYATLTTCVDSLFHNVGSLGSPRIKDKVVQLNDENMIGRSIIKVVISHPND